MKNNPAAFINGLGHHENFLQVTLRYFKTIPHSFIALLGRFSIAAAFWQSGQTKVEGFAIDLVAVVFNLGLPRLSDSAVALFQEEYHIPLLSPEIAAYMAAFAEHFFPVCLLLGIGTRFAALGLLGMTLVIQLFVYPGAYPTHGTWAALLLWLIALGPGRISIDAYLANRYSAKQGAASI